MPLNAKHMPDKRSPCPVSTALDLIGDKWTLLLVRDMIWLNKHRYGEFAESPEGIPTNILADRLKRMTAHGLIEKRAYQNNPPRYEYHLTESGKALKPIVGAMLKWGIKYLPDVWVPSDEELRRIRRR